MYCHTQLYAFFYAYLSQCMHLTSWSNPNQAATYPVSRQVPLLSCTMKEGSNKFRKRTNRCGAKRPPQCLRNSLNKSQRGQYGFSLEFFCWVRLLAMVCSLMLRDSLLSSGSAPNQRQISKWYASSDSLFFKKALLLLATC